MYAAVYLPMLNPEAPVFFKVNQVLVSNILLFFTLLSPESKMIQFDEDIRQRGLKQITKLGRAITIFYPFVRGHFFGGYTVEPFAHLTNSPQNVLFMKLIRLNLLALRIQTHP